VKQNNRNEFAKKIKNLNTCATFIEQHLRQIVTSFAKQTRFE